MRVCSACRATVLKTLEFCPLDGCPLVEVNEDPMVGHTFDRYQIEERLGSGAMGSVYRVRPPELERDLAIKVLHADVAANRTLVARLEREAEALSRVHHGNIVSVVDFVRTPHGLCGLLMEFLPGENLAAILAREAPMAPGRVRGLARGIALGLSEAHRQGLVHRDVKPSNVLVVREGEDEIPKLVDFGLVLRIYRDPEANRLTGENDLLGTPQYMAPEQARAEETSPAADLYALGVMMYEMLSGRVPFTGASASEVLIKHAIEEPTPLPKYEGLGPLVMGLLAKNPWSRPPSANEVVARLDNQAAGRSKDAPPRSLAVAASLAILMAALSGLVLVLSQSPSEVPSPPAAAQMRLVADAGPSSALTLPRPGPKPGAAKPLRDRIAALERRLARVLNERGLSRADLPELPSTRRAHRRWKRAAARRDHLATSRALEDLIYAARKAKLSPRILERRLDRLLKSIRGSRREVPAILTEDIERRYFQLRVRAREAYSRQDFRQVAELIKLLEERHRRYVYGD